MTLARLENGRKVGPGRPYLDTTRMRKLDRVDSQSVGSAASQLIIIIVHVKPKSKRSDWQISTMLTRD